MIIVNWLEKEKINHKLSMKLSLLQILTWIIVIPEIEKKIFLNLIYWDN